MLICRLLLGISEAAFGPGIPFYLSFFFKRNELAYRVGLFISAAPLASTFASSLAYGITSLSDKLPIQGWRLLFILEGVPSLVVAVWAWPWIPDSPSSARWLNGRERKIATLRLRKEHQSNLPPENIQKSSTRAPKCRRPFLDLSEIRKTLLDPKGYLTALMFFSANIAFSSMPVFAPIIIHSIGYSSLAAQGLSALPNLFAFVIVLLISTVSDRFQMRSLPIVGVALMAMTGYILLALATPLHMSNTLRYLCLFPITAGFFPAVTLIIVWTLDNQASDEGKGTGVAMLNIIGQIGPLVGTGLYPEHEAPGYVRGHAVCAIFMGVVAVLALGLRVVLGRENRRTEQRGRYAMVGGMDGEVTGTAAADDGAGGEFVFML